jgi:hypothetical protein
MVNLPSFEEIATIIWGFAASDFLPAVGGSRG